MSKHRKSAREGFGNDSGSPLLKSAIFTSCFYFRVIKYLANFTRAILLLKGEIEALEKVQKYALKVCTKSWDASYENLLSKASLPSLQQRNFFTK